MTILISRRPSAIGGPSTFIANLARGLKARGHQVVFAPNQPYDTLLVIAQCSLTLILSAKLRHKRIVQRLDGVYHPGLPGPTHYFYHLRNLRMKLTHNYLADHIVYQSKFAKHMCQQLLGKPRGETSITYNAAFVPERVTRPGSPAPVIKLITAASFRRRDQIQPIMNSLKHLSIPFELHIYGPHHQRLQPFFTKASQQTNIHLHGPINNQPLLAQLSQHDIFLFSDQSACPNIVIEAQALGLPVVAFNRGSLIELIKPGLTGQLVDLPSHQPLRDQYPFDKKSYQHFAQAIATVASELTAYQTASRQHAQQYYDITHMLNQYANILRPS